MTSKTPDIVKSVSRRVKRGVSMSWLVELLATTISSFVDTCDTLFIVAVFLKKRVIMQNATGGRLQGVPLYT